MFIIQLRRKIVADKLTEMYDTSTADKYLKQLENHEIYAHDETGVPMMPYCAAITLYPFLENGLKDVGGESKAPKHLSSFVGGLINLIFIVSSQFVGAVAAVETLALFDKFARDDFGDDYLYTHESEIQQYLQQFVYSINQPAGARAYQSVFFNLSVFDKDYFDGLFGNFVLPDGSKLKWETTDKLQKYFLKWFAKEREKSVLTFPVVTVALKTENKKVVSRDYHNFLARELSMGNSFFIYMSDDVDTLSSCCRLRNGLKNDFSYTLGGVGISTGSLNVITLNMNRIVQNWTRDKESGECSLEQYLATILADIYKYQSAYHQIFKELEAAKMLPVYDAGFIRMQNQYLTIGLNGIVEAAEFLGLTPNYNDEYLEFLQKVLGTISTNNAKAAQEYGFKINTELVPAENLGVKNALWDKQDGYVVSRDVYNSYLYLVEDDGVSFIDKLRIHGDEILKYLDGGSAVHLNFAEYPTKEGFQCMLDVMALAGSNYATSNVKVTCCENADCGHIDKRTLQRCSKCGSENIVYATRIIGYLKKIKNWSKSRRVEEGVRFYEN